MNSRRVNIIKTGTCQKKTYSTAIPPNFKTNTRRAKPVPTGSRYYSWYSWLLYFRSEKGQCIDFYSRQPDVKQYSRSDLEHLGSLYIQPIAEQNHNSLPLLQETMK